MEMKKILNFKTQQKKINKIREALLIYLLSNSLGVKIFFIKGE